MRNIKIESLYDYVLQQIAAESYLEDRTNISDERYVKGQLALGTNRVGYKDGPFNINEGWPGYTRMTSSQAQEFWDKFQIIHQWSDNPATKNGIPVASRPAAEGNPAFAQLNDEILANTGFSATLIKNRYSDGPIPEYTLSFRSTESRSWDEGGDSERDMNPTDFFGVALSGFALAQLDAMEQYYQWLKNNNMIPMGANLNVTGYSLGGHLATIFTEIHHNDIDIIFGETVTFNGAGRGNWLDKGGSLKEIIDFYHEVLIDPTTWLIPNPLDVVGSLALLAEAKLLQGTLFDSTSVYNDARYEWATLATKLRFGLLPQLPGTAGGTAADSSITQVYGYETISNVNVTANSQNNAPEVGVGIESQPLEEGGSGLFGLPGNYGSGHSIDLIADSLVLQRAMRQLDASLTLDKFIGMLPASTNRDTHNTVNAKYEADALENILDGLRYTIEGPTGFSKTQYKDEASGFGDWGSRNIYHDNIKVLTDRQEFQALLGKVTLSVPDATLEARARDDFSALAALINLSPVVIKATAGNEAVVEAQLSNAWGDIYNHWKSDKDAVHALDPKTPDYFTDNWIKDRASMLSWVLQMNRENSENHITYGSALGPDSWKFEDLNSGQWVSAVSPTNGSRQHSVIFDADVSVTPITGGDFTDHLYAGAGGSELHGGEGDDYLEGNSGADKLNGDVGRDVLRALGGDDTLAGGKGADRLEGGKGNDTYLITKGDGVDTIFDSDGLGIIKIDGVTLTGGKKESENSWISADNKFRYVMVNAADGTQKLQVFPVGGNTGPDPTMLYIEKFTSGNLGITLEDPPAADPAQTKVILGDVQATDFAEQDGTTYFTYHYDDLGNIVGTPNTQSRADELFGSAGIDEIHGGAGNDSLHGRDGDDTLFGDAGNDLVTGGQGSDDISGGEGSDVLYGDATYGLANTRAGTILSNARPPVPEATFVASGINWIRYETDFASLPPVSNANTGVITPVLNQLSPERFGTVGLFTAELTRYGQGVGGDDVINAGAGDDLVYGEAGNDHLMGGAGDDHVFGGSGDDLVDGGDGDDLILGDDMVYAQFRASTLDILGRYHLTPEVETYENEFGNDLLFGGSGDDYMFGMAGADILYGEAGNDYMVGDFFEIIGIPVLVWSEDGSEWVQDTSTHFTEAVQYHGNDVLDGGEGDDYLVGLAGDDQLLGGAGKDVLLGDGSPDEVQGRYGNDYLDGGDGNDFLQGSGGNDELHGGAGDDELWGDEYAGDHGKPLGSWGSAPVNSSEQTGLLAQGKHGNDFLDGGDGNDVLTGGGFDDLLEGGAGNDLMIGDGTGVTNEGNDQLFGGTGNDELQGNGGDDFLSGDEGDDRLYGGDGIDVLQAGIGDDYLEGGKGDDKLSGAEGSDTLWGNEGDDTLDAGAGDDSLDGGDGNDTLTGGAGVDYLRGGAGDDAFILKAGDGEIRDNGFETIDDVTGNNTLRFDGISAASIIVRKAAVPGDLAIQYGAADGVYIKGGMTGAVNTFGLGSDVSPTTLTPAHSYSDAHSETRVVTDPAMLSWFNFVGSVSDNPAVAPPLLSPDSTPATSSTVPGPSTATLSWMDFLGYYLEDSIDVTGDGVHQGLAGGRVSDHLVAVAAETISGGGGNDTIELNGGGNTVLYRLGDGVDTLQGFGSGQTRIRFGQGIAAADIHLRIVGDPAAYNGNYGDMLCIDVGDAVSGFNVRGLVNRSSLSASASAIMFEFSDGSEKLLGDYFANGFVFAGTSGTDHLDGTDVNDSMSGGDGDDWLQAGAGNDVLSGGNGNDFMRGNAGDDALLGAEGNDSLYGDNGADSLDGGAGDDYLNGGEGNDTLFGADGVDTFYGGSGADILDGGSGNDALNGEDGNDILRGADGQDLLYGGNDADSLDGGAGNDSLSGDDGNDILLGGNGQDSLYGGNGADSLDGGAGNDSLEGGLGADTYLYRMGDGEDTINDRGSDNAVDILRFGEGITASNLVIVHEQDDLVIRFNGTWGKVRLIGQANTALPLIERVEFSDGSFLTAAELLSRSVPGPVPIYLRGTDDADSLLGESLGDRLEGLGGNDYLYGLAGDDVMDAGDGNDYLEGGDGNDTLLGAEGQDALYGGNGTDSLDGGNDSDSLYGEAGTDLLNGGAGSDELRGGTGSDRLYGGVGDDYLDGDNHYGSGDGTGPGDGAVDYLYGGSGNDVYVLRERADQMIEYSGEGWDSVHVYFSGTWTLPDNVEGISLETTNESNQITGNALDNVFYAGHNTFEQSTNTSLGVDVLIGGDGNDTYYNVSFNDVVVEAVNGGIDTVYTRNTIFTLSANVENATTQSILVGTAHYGRSLYGNDLDNILTTGTNEDTFISSGRGNDTVYGGSGNDQIYGNDGDDFIFDRSGTNYLNGGAGSNVMEGGSGADTLVSEGNNDALTGGGGNDRLVLGAGLANCIFYSASGDDRIETGNGGFSLDFRSSYLTDITNVTAQNGVLKISYITREDRNTVSTLSITLAGMDKLVQVKMLDTTLTAAAFYQWLLDHPERYISTANVTGAASRLLAVRTGGDLLVQGVNSLGAIQNSFAVQNGTPIDPFRIESDGSLRCINAGAGIANVMFDKGYSNPYTLHAGTDGADDFSVMDRAGASDWYIGGNGVDTYHFGADSGNDTIDVGNANQSKDIIQMDFVRSSCGLAFSLNSNDLSISHASGNGNLHVIDFFSAAIVTPALRFSDGEILTIAGIYLQQYGATAGNDVITGTVNDDSLYGWTGNDILKGMDGNDSLNGGAGADQMTGGNGDDYYMVDNTGDAVVELANGGTDSVSAAIDFTLAVNVENGNLLGSANLNMTGNSANNIISGNNGNNRLDGGGGADYLEGMYGSDTYVVDNITTSWVWNGVTHVGDFVEDGDNPETGIIDIDTVEASVTYTLGAFLENLTLTGSGVINGTGNELDNVLRGNSAVNVLKGKAGNDIYYVSTGDTVTENASEGTDRIISDVSFTLGSNIENLILTGSSAINATGNALVNVITGNDGNNILDGGAGADALKGGIGNDTYLVDNAGDTVTENSSEGIDAVQSSVAFTLGNNIENLTLTGALAINGTGNALDNVITGNSAANVLTGGAGNDTYIVGAGDTVTENVNEGVDVVQSGIAWTLGNSIENLTLTGSGNVAGTGNALDNILTGNSGTNILKGGAGNDTYIVAAGDTVTENANEGVDAVQSSVAFTLGNNIENLTLTGTGNIAGTGNALDNILTGNSGTNALSGGAGNDTYIVGAGDTVTESASAGADSVQSSVAFTLGANVENLTLTGSTAINGTGNTLANVLRGNSAANTLTGGAGNDTYLFGRGGAADIIVDTDSTAGNADRLLLDSGIAYDQLWFKHVGTSLEVSVIGTSDKVTISNWYNGTGNHVEKVQVADGHYLVDTKVEALVQAMAGMTAPPAGQLTLTTAQHQQLDTVLAANWAA